MSQFNVGGLVSGLDTNALIDGLMTAARVPQRRMESARADATIRQAAWNGVGGRVERLAAAIDELRANGSLGAVTATSSHDTIARVTAVNGATAGRVAFRVDSLAAASQHSSVGLTGADALVGAGTAYVSRGLGAVGVTALGATTLATGTYELEVVSISGSDATVIFDGVEQVISTTTGTATLNGADEATLEITTGTALTVGTASVTVVNTTASTTVAQFATALNQAGGPARALVVDTGADGPTPYRLLVTATDTGVDNAVTISRSGLAGLGTGFTTLRAAADASVTIGGAGGLTITRGSNTLTDVFAGMTVELTAAAPTTDVEIVTNEDEAARFEAVKKVVDELNGIIGDLRTKAKYDVESGRGGPLVGDFGARQVEAMLQQAAATVRPGGDYALMAQIGIRMARDGTFTIDEIQLKNALKRNAAEVDRLLLGSATDETDGVFDKLAETAAGLTADDGAVATAVRSSQSTVDELTSAIRAHEDRLDILQERYLRQFAAMETTLSQLRSQSQYLTSVLANRNQQR
jgi:flagellar hook-associated protein 2